MKMLVTLVILINLVVFVLVLYFRWVLRREPPSRARTNRIMAGGVGMVFLAFACYLMAGVLPTIEGMAEYEDTILLGAVLVWLLLSLLLLRQLWPGSWRQTMGAAAGAWLLMAAVLASMALAFEPWLMTAWTVQGSTMAPTLLGPHFDAMCPRCGATAHVGNELNEHWASRQDRLGICRLCLNTSPIDDPKAKRQAADRILIERGQTPERWDLVLVRLPVGEDKVAVMRVLGLPGEEIVIKEQGVWVDGVRQNPPKEAAIGFIQYESNLDGWDKQTWAAPDKPVQLQTDEYFLLGDFSRRSMDSRAFGPVKRDHIEGVAALILWPTTRLRILK